MFAGWYGRLTTRDFRIRERLGWSFLFALSGACLLQLQDWFFTDWKTASTSREPEAGLASGLARGYSVPLWEVGAPVVLGVIYLASLVLAIGFHPVNVLKHGWAAFKAYFADREKRRLAAMEETERMEFERRKLPRQAEKLERKLKKKGEAARRAPRNPRNRRSRTPHYRRYLPAGEAPLIGRN